MSNTVEEQSQDGDWGWEPLGSEDEEPENGRAISNVRQDPEGGDAEHKAPTNPSKGSSEKVLSPRKGSHGSLTGSNSSKTMPGIVSSPSFLELEKAIGATLNLASNDSGDLNESRQLSPSAPFPASKLSSTNLTQQKLNQQRMRQNHHQNQRYASQSQHNRFPGGYGSYGSLPQAIHMQQQQSQPARVELAPFINESESRAIILFHSAHLSTVDIRNACSKYGVLYYIRPEFHGKGVTLISYFDLRAASAAKASIVEDLGRSADASAHFSVMLHAANGNSEEFRLVVRNLPADRCSEAEVQSIFARYGQLRSIQKTFEEGGGVEGAVGSNSTSEKTDGGATATATAAGTSDGAHADESNCSTNGSNDGDGAEDSDSCKIAYSIEFYNIQDARLAASELSATSAQLWNADVTVKFAPLDERKQQLCKQLLATLSRWRSEMASAMAYNMSLQQQQQQFHQQQQAQQQAYMQQQQQGRQMMMGGNGMLGNVSMGMNMGMMSPMVYGMPQQHQQQQQSQQVMAVGGMVDMNGGMSGGMSGYGAPQLQQQQQLSQFQQQPMVNSGSYTDLTLLQHQQNQQMAMAMNMPPGPAAMPMPMQQLQQQQRVLYGTAPSSVDGSSGTLGGAMGVGGGVPVVLRGPSPMHALMPANLSNPNLFNLGLLAAQAEAQMQQQQIQQQQMQQQQASMHQHQGQSVSPVPQSAGGSTEAGSFGSEGSPAGAAQYARSSAQQQQQQQGQVGNNNNNRYGGSNAGPRHHNQNRGGGSSGSSQGQQSAVPPHHHNGGYVHGGSGIHNSNSYGGAMLPMQMQQMQVMQSYSNGALTSGAQLPPHVHQQQFSHQQQQQLQGQGQGQAGRGGRMGGGKRQQQPGGQQYGYPSSSSGSPSPSHAGGGGGVGGGRGDAGQQIDADFALDLKRIGDDVETRTTIMVRNIPNKYNQQMLLEEVNVSHEGTYDFFYLPIDFKNRCNVGYCFINFLDPKHIPPFVNAFNGQRWKSFNSEKVCAVSFARIQGKQAMIARFQNSSLLEKDDEYQPLLFYSSGPDRGKPEPFPVSTAVRSRPPQQHPQQQHMQGTGGGMTYAPQQQHGQQQQPPPHHHHHLQHPQHRSRANTSTPPVPVSASAPQQGRSSHSPSPTHSHAPSPAPSQQEAQVKAPPVEERSISSPESGTEAIGAGASAAVVVVVEQNA